MTRQDEQKKGCVDVDVSRGEITSSSICSLKITTPAPTTTMLHVMLAVGIVGGRIIKDGQYYTFTHKHLPPPSYTHTHKHSNIDDTTHNCHSKLVPTLLITLYTSVPDTSKLIKLTITLGHLLPPTHTHRHLPPPSP